MFRSANFDDLPALRSLYALCFSSDDETLGRIASTGLEEIGQGRTILVHERDGQIVGFLEAEEVFQQHHMITRLAVHPDFRRSRVATRLLDKILDNGRATDTVISLIVQADDYLVLKLALSLGFMAHSTVPDSSVTKSVRLYLRYHSEHRGQIRRNETFVLPASIENRISTLLDSGEYAITNVKMTSNGQMFEVCRLSRDDISALKSDENTASVSFAGSILAAITFILGISLASTNFPNDVRILLIAATFATLLSLVIYTNATGNLSRIRSNRTDSYPRWGNVLSEYGGVFPFLISLPVAFAEVANSFGAALITAAASSVALLLYMRSRFSLSTRYPTSATTRILHTVVCLDPLLGVLSATYLRVAWPWTVGTILVLAALSSVYLYRNIEESLQHQNSAEPPGNHGTHRHESRQGNPRNLPPSSRTQ